MKWPVPGRQFAPGRRLARRVGGDGLQDFYGARPKVSGRRGRKQNQRVADQIRGPV